VVPAGNFKAASQKARRRLVAPAPAAAGVAAEDTGAAEGFDEDDDVAVVLRRAAAALSDPHSVRSRLETEQLLDLETLVLMSAADFGEIGLSLSDSVALVDAAQQESRVRELQQQQQPPLQQHHQKYGSISKGGSEGDDGANNRMRADISTLMELLPSNVGLDMQHVECTFRLPHIMTFFLFEKSIQIAFKLVSFCLCASFSRVVRRLPRALHAASRRGEPLPRGKLRLGR
jgi:hypothetical protein